MSASQSWLLYFVSCRVLSFILIKKYFTWVLFLLQTYYYTITLASEFNNIVPRISLLYTLALVLASKGCGHSGTSYIHPLCNTVWLYVGVQFLAQVHPWLGNCIHVYNVVRHDNLTHSRIVITYFSFTTFSSFSYLWILLMCWPQLWSHFLLNVVWMEV